MSRVISRTCVLSCSKCDQGKNMVFHYSPLRGHFWCSRSLFRGWVPRSGQRPEPACQSRKWAPEPRGQKSAPDPDFPRKSPLGALFRPPAKKACFLRLTPLRFFWPGFRSFCRKNEKNGKKCAPKKALFSTFFFPGRKSQKNQWCSWQKKRRGRFSPKKAANYRRTKIEFRI